MLQMVMRPAIAERRDRRAGELHRLVERSVHTDHADDVQDEVLRAHAWPELAGDIELETLGHLEPRAAGAIPTPASVEPTPVANAPSAPYVHVWLSAP